MKKVVGNFYDCGIVKVENVGIDRWYGVMNSDSSVKGFVTREKYDSGNFVIRCGMALTNGNGWNCYDCCSLNQLIQSLLYHGFSVFEFNDDKELFKWLIE